MSDYSDDNEDHLDEIDPRHFLPDQKAIRVKKGEELNVTRLDPTIRDVTIGVGWDLKRFEGDPIDLDVSVFLLDKNDKTREDEDFIFYNNLIAREGAVKHMGDSRTGAGDGDDENILLNLMSLPFEVMKIAFVLSIYDLDLNSNNFSMVKNVYFRMVNNETKLETFRAEMDQELGEATGLYLGYIERVGSDWIYKAVAEPIYGGLSKIAADFGIIVAQNMRG